MGSFGGTPAEQEVVYPWGTEKARKFAYPHLARGVRGELVPWEERAINRARNAALANAAIARERYLRSSGRMPGAAGPERIPYLQAMDEESIRAAAAAEPSLLGDVQAKYLGHMLRFGEASGQVIEKAGQAGWGAPLLQAVGTIGGAMIGGPAGAVIGSSLGSVAGQATQASQGSVSGGQYQSPGQYYGTEDPYGRQYQATQLRAI